MSGYRWSGGGEEQRQKEVDAELESIRAEAKRRTGWEEWMTETAGWGALDPDFVRLAERKDSGR